MTIDASPCDKPVAAIVPRSARPAPHGQHRRRASSQRSHERALSLRPGSIRTAAAAHRPPRASPRYRNAPQQQQPVQPQRQQQQQPGRAQEMKQLDHQRLHIRAPPASRASSSASASGHMNSALTGRRFCRSSRQRFEAVEQRRKFCLQLLRCRARGNIGHRSGARFRAGFFRRAGRRIDPARAEPGCLDFFVGADTDGINLEAAARRPARPPSAASPRRRYWRRRSSGSARANRPIRDRGV